MGLWWVFFSRLKFQGHHAVDAALDFDQRASDQRAGAEFGMLAVEEVPADDRQFEILALFPREPHIHGDITLNARGESVEFIHVPKAHAARPQQSQCACARRTGCWRVILRARRDLGTGGEEKVFFIRFIVMILMP